MKINKKLSVMAGRDSDMGPIICSRNDFQYELKNLRKHYKKDDNAVIINYFESRYNKGMERLSFCTGGFMGYFLLGFPRTVARAGLFFLLGNHLEYREARRLAVHP